LGKSLIRLESSGGPALRSAFARSRVNATIWLIVAALILRLVFAGSTGLQVDESYMVASSHGFDASYFDHPLASWWLELAARALTGSVAPIVVRLPFVALSGVTSWLVFIITRRVFDERAGFWAVVAYTIAPVFSLAGCWVLPDGPANAALAAFLYALIRALGLPEEKPQPGWWLLAGLFAGLALDAKYNTSLVIAGAGLGILSAPSLRRALLLRQVWLAGLIALAVVSPVIWWNANHHWISFHYQGRRVSGLHLRPYMPFYVWGGEALFLLPWVWLPMIAALIRTLRAGPSQAGPWLLAWAGLVPVVLFATISLWSSTHILFHWAAPGELMLLPLLGRWARDFAPPRLRNNVARASAALLAGAMLFIAAEVQFGFIPNPGLLSKPGKSPLLQTIDWTSLAAQIPPGIDAIAAQRWYDAGKIGYGLERAGDKIPVTVVAGEIHEFLFSAPPESFVGKTVLVLSMPWNMQQTASFCARFFKTFTSGPVLLVKFHGQVLLAIPTYIGTKMISPPVPAPNSPGITPF
jgi:4-amino-4-deoxy-L-arabinose transferase-like glycosyltransferase